jgi:hypothetical protein
VRADRCIECGRTIHDGDEFERTATGPLCRRCADEIPAQVAASGHASPPGPRPAHTPPAQSSLMDAQFDLALDSATIAVAALRPAVAALREIAELELPGWEIAVRGLREVKDAIVGDHQDDKAASHYAGVLREASANVVPIDRLDAALGEGRR